MYQSVFINTGATRLVLFLAMLLVTANASAADGRLEINQACVNAGCFPEDSPGLPVEINNPGSYVFTSNLQQTQSGGTGIRILSDRVTLDLNGFVLSGPDALNGHNGVAVEAKRAEIRNGQILGFNQAIFPVGGGENGDHSRAIGLTVSDYDNSGIRLGSYSLVRDCSISGDHTGIFMAAHSVAEGNRIVMTGALDTADGISISSHGLVRDNIVRDSPGDGISVGAVSIVSRNIVRSNGLSGIRATGNGSVIEQNAVVSNQNFGIEVLNGTNHLIRGNNVLNNNQSGGIFTNIEDCPTCTLIDNHAP